MSEVEFSQSDRRLLAAGGIAAIASQTLMWTAFLVLGLVRPGYNLVTEAGSHLGEKGAPNALLFNVTHFYVAGLLLIAFAIGLYRAVGARRSGKAASALMTVGGVCVILAGVFTLDPTSPQASMLHRTIAIPFFLGIPFVALLVARALRRNGRWQGQRSFSLRMGVLLLLILVASIASMLYDVPVGVSQRVSTAAFTVWFVGMGLWLLRLSARPAAERDDVTQPISGEATARPITQ